MPLLLREIFHTFMKYGEPSGKMYGHTTQANIPAWMIRFFDDKRGLPRKIPP